jgi:hypothetical protein
VTDILRTQGDVLYPQPALPGRLRGGLICCGWLLKADSDFTAWAGQRPISRLGIPGGITRIVDFLEIEQVLEKLRYRMHIVLRNMKC